MKKLSNQWKINFEDREKTKKVKCIIWNKAGLKKVTYVREERTFFHVQRSSTLSKIGGEYCFYRLVGDDYI